MANKRILKRKINSVCGDLFAECVVLAQLGVKTDRDNINALLTSILVTNNDFIRRVSHPEPGMAPKAYYKDVVDHFNKAVCEMTDQLSNLN